MANMVFAINNNMINSFKCLFFILKVSHLILLFARYPQNSQRIGFAVNFECAGNA